MRANGRTAAVLARLDALEGRADAAARRSARAQGLGYGLVVLSCSVASVLMLPATAPAVADWTIPPPVVAALVLLPLALVDPMLGAVDAAPAVAPRWPPPCAGSGPGTSGLSSVQGVTRARVP